MLPRVINKLISIFIVLGGALHSGLGCCAHHSHTACFGHEHCGVPGEAAAPSAAAEVHPCCDHLHESTHEEIESTSCEPNRNSGSNDSPADCRHSKCAFTTFGLMKVDNFGADEAIDSYLFDVFNLMMDGQRAEREKHCSFRVLSWLGAASARPQQLLCVWRI